MSCVLDTCCCCIELRTGCLILGYLQLVGDMVMIVGGLVFLLGGGVIAADANDQDQMVAGMSVIALGIGLLVVGLFMLSYTIVLLVGVHQNKRGHVKAYLILTCISLVLDVLGLLSSFTKTNKNWESIIALIVNILLNTYCLLVIRSHHLKMDDIRPQIYYTAPRLPALAHASGPPIPQNYPSLPAPAYASGPPIPQNYPSLPPPAYASGPYIPCSVPDGNHKIYI